MTTSLSDIRPGDKVILQCPRPYTKVATVDRVTKTQIIIGLKRFRISDGKQLASSDQWFYHWIIPATPEKIAEVERQQQQLRRDQERVYQLAKQINRYESQNAAAAIPHLEAALVALKQEDN